MILVSVFLIICGLVVVIKKFKKNSKLKIEDETYLLMGIFSLIVGLFSLLNVIIYN
ncbi:hypothetical protein GOQ29_14080 [Clostridium sp. D2Q-14]|nr:hypothetical protein [Anaeromonas gelatinilytica]